jgi:hypothetical protein
MAGFFKNHKISIGLLIAGVAALCLYTYFYGQQAHYEPRRTPPEKIITFSGIEIENIKSATLLMNGKTEAVGYDSNALELSQDQISSFSLPYEIKISAQGKNGSFKDFSWRVDERGVDYHALIDGFSPRDRVSLFVNEQKIYTIPFDWSGRIELPVLLIIEEDSKICFDVEQAQENRINFCHFITGRRL